MNRSDGDPAGEQPRQLEDMGTQLEASPGLHLGGGRMGTSEQAGLSYKMTDFTTDPRRKDGELPTCNSQKSFPPNPSLTRNPILASCAETEN